LFAFWFSGTISCRFGKLLHYEHHGYDSTYEGRLLLFFEEGLLVGQRVVHYKPEVSRHAGDDFDAEDDLELQALIDHDGQDANEQDG